MEVSTADNDDTCDDGRVDGSGRRGCRKENVEETLIVGKSLSPKLASNCFECWKLRSCVY